MPPAASSPSRASTAAGKSTQLARLAAGCAPGARRCVETREPGGSPGAEAIRDLLVVGDPGRWSPETEILLFTAARRDHLERTIRPALARGATVLCDRFANSTRVYQGTVRADLRAHGRRAACPAVGLEPDLTLILDLDPALARRRDAARGGDENRFERFGPEFQESGCAPASSPSPPSSPTAAGWCRRTAPPKRSPPASPPPQRHEASIAQPR